MTCEHQTIKDSDMHVIVCMRGHSSTTTPKGSCKDWIKPGALAWLKIGSKKHEVEIKSFKYASGGDYYWCEVEIQTVNPFCPSQVLRQLYPEAVQSYRLTQRKIEEK